MHSSAALDEDSYVVCGRLILFVNLGISIFSIYTSYSCQWYSITLRCLAHLWLPCIIVIRHPRFVLATFLINQMIQKTRVIGRTWLACKAGFLTWLSFKLSSACITLCSGFCACKNKKNYNYDELATWNFLPVTLSTILFYSASHPQTGGLCVWQD